MNELQQKIEALCQKWIDREVAIRSLVHWATDAIAASRYSARADELSKARRELQECAKLVVVPKQEDL